MNTATDNYLELARTAVADYCGTDCDNDHHDHATGVAADAHEMCEWFEAEYGLVVVGIRLCDAYSGELRPVWVLDCGPMHSAEITDHEDGLHGNYSLTVDGKQRRNDNAVDLERVALLLGGL